jgi:hypothetical protein
VPVTDILKPTVRATRWWGLVTLAVPSAYVMWHLQNTLYPSAASLGWGIRIAAVMLAAGLAFTLDDPTEEMTGCAPVSIATQRAVRIGLALPPALAFWLCLRTHAAGNLTSPESMPIAALSLEFITFAFVAYAGAAVGSRVLSDRLGGIAGAGTVLLVALGLALFPWGSGILTRTPGTAEATSAAVWWWTLLTLSGFTWWRLSLPPGMPMWRRPSLRLASHG